MGGRVAVLILMGLLLVAPGPWGAAGLLGVSEAAARESLAQAMVRAKELEQSGKLEEAVRYLEREVTLRGGTVEAFNLLGSLYAKTGDFRRAEGAFTRALGRDPENLFARLWFGIARLAQEDLKGAFEAFYGLAKIRPENEGEQYFLAGAYYYLGAIYSFRGYRKEALEALKAARQANPRDPETRYRLGVLYYDMEQPAQAEAEFREALRLNGRHVKASNALGWFYYNSGRRAEARGMWERTLRFSPQNNEARDSLARFYNDAALGMFEAGNREEAKRLWRKVQHYDSKNRAAAYYLKKYR